MRRLLPAPPCTDGPVPGHVLLHLGGAGHLWILKGLSEAEASGCRVQVELQGQGKEGTVEL